MSSHRHCADFTRSQLLAQAGARAGRGLPAVEPGAPAPAGTGMTRRSMLVRGTGMAVSVYGASHLLGLRRLQEGVAAAAEVPPGPVLVSVFLPGGIDAMSLLAPVGDPLYAKLRPKLSLPGSAGLTFSEDPRLQWHPAATGLQSLHREGKLAVMPAVGYDHPDQSHFASRHFWEIGALDPRGTTGWIGRYLDAVGSPDNPLQGLSLGGTLQPMLATSAVPVAALASPSDYSFGADGVWGDIETLMLDGFARLGAAHAGSAPALSQAAHTAIQAATLRTQLTPLAGKNGKPGYTSPVTYPAPEGHSASDSLPARLAGLAAMLAAGLPLRCVAIEAPGDFDTHQHQPDSLTKGIENVSAALLAFQRDLEARGLADRVVVQVWSEFGRRAAENGSAGTDHGAAGVGMLIGTRVNGHLIGEFPGLAAGLDKDGNLRATTDFRATYCALLEQWLGFDAARVIPDAAKLARPRVIR